MHRYEELEKLYYKKKRIKILIFFIISLFFLISFYIILNSKKFFNQKKITEVKENLILEKNISVGINKKENNISIKKKKILVTDKNKSSISYKKIVKLTFILPKLDKDDINLVKSSQKQNKNKIKNNKPQKTIQETPKIITKNIQLKEKKTDINNLIKKFEANPSYDLALSIAKYYYNLNKIKLAHIWTIKANNLNPSKVDSWIMFADILKKEGKTQKAKEILKIYIEQYGDNEKIIKKLRSLGE